MQRFQFHDPHANEAHRYYNPFSSARADQTHELAGLLKADGTSDEGTARRIKAEYELGSANIKDALRLIKDETFVLGR